MIMNSYQESQKVAGLTAVQWVIVLVVGLAGWLLVNQPTTPGPSPSPVPDKLQLQQYEELAYDGYAKTIDAAARLYETGASKLKNGDFKDGDAALDWIDGAFQSAMQDALLSVNDAEDRAVQKAYDDKSDLAKGLEPVWTGYAAGLRKLQARTEK